MLGTLSNTRRLSAKTVKARRARAYLEDLEVLFALPTSRRYRALVLDEYPFDLQLLTLSRLYRASRTSYLAIQGAYSRRLASTMRSLGEDLFANDLDFAPALSEVIWFKDHVRGMSAADAGDEIEALVRFNDISLFHEQNHRVIWRLLPPAPSGQRDLRRYLNFAESLVVALDIALGDETGPLSAAFQRMNLLYRRAGDNHWRRKSKQEYRRYLLAILCATYCVLELIENKDVVKAVDYVFPDQHELNRDAVRCSLTLSEPFVVTTNPRWQRRHWKTAGRKLRDIHEGSRKQPLRLPADPLDLHAELSHAHRVFDHYGL